MTRRLEQILSSGQLGADRGALDVALALGMRVGGWCPRDRRADDGRVPERYPLRETPLKAYIQAIEWNVRDADATLVLTRGTLAPGPAVSIEFATRLRKPYRVVDLDHPEDLPSLREWIDAQRLRILNVSGPRETRCPGIREAAAGLVRALCAPQEPEAVPAGPPSHGAIPLPCAEPPPRLLSWLQPPGAGEGPRGAPEPAA